MRTCVARRSLGSALIDLHCHILPGLDDGALDLEDSVGMALQADRDGIATICATPHIRHDHEVLVHELADRVEAVNRELERRGLVARVTVGGELAETSLDAVDEAELAGLSLGGGGRWVLLEPAPGPLGDSLSAAVDGLLERGYRAVVAHPERHLGEGAEERLAALVERGALIQITAALLEHEQGAPTAIRLAERGLVHLLGSDAHSSHAGRPVRLSRAVTALHEAEALRGHIDWMVREAPRAILHGEDVEPPYPPVRG
jgi:protein-tyrosine phosphatase